jgi:hypothetical protein
VAHYHGKGREADEMLKAVRDLYARGLELHWLYPKTKKPIGEGWSTHPKRSLEDLKQSYESGYNLGVRTGRWSTPEEGKALIIIDMDVKSTDPHHALESQAAVEDLLGDASLYPCVASGRGNGSAHYYVAAEIEQLPSNTVYRVSPEAVMVMIGGEGKQRPAWQVEILSTGKQAVVPPSIHPDTGEAYRWIVPIRTYAAIRTRSNAGNGICERLRMRCRLN